MEQAGIASTADVLRAARKLIEDPAGWAGSVGELDGDHHCMATAVGTCGPPYQYLLRVINARALGTYNDSRTHAEVLAAFDRAIDLAEAEA